MSSETGRKIRVSIFGESHGTAIGAVVDNLPAGEYIDFDELQSFLQRRQGGNNKYSTPRKEADIPEILSGVKDGYTTGAPLCLVIKNENTRSQDYKVDIPRPGHADFSAFVKYNGFCDLRGGGHFSGRLTAPACAVGGILMQILKRRGVDIVAHLASVGECTDDKIDVLKLDEGQYSKIKSGAFPTFSNDAGEQMQDLIVGVKEDGNSIGGCVECGIYGIEAGVGDPLFEGIENVIAKDVFGIGGVRGIEFGAGFEASKMKGSENNDEFFIENDKVRTKTNNHGGVLGGITTGMPIIFKVAFKPTPSISIGQSSISLSENKNVEEFSTRGRHDPCIAVRAVPCVEAIAAIAIADFLL
ncbi:MAG: chorismate synthase [Clostridia bacterium]|nr:chorismate synthase [Clostridia bacterium]